MKGNVKSREGGIIRGTVHAVPTIRATITKKVK